MYAEFMAAKGYVLGIGYQNKGKLMRQILFVGIVG